MTGAWIDRVRERNAPERIILDRESSESLTTSRRARHLNNDFLRELDERMMNVAGRYLESPG